jgi:hypothetical protein
VTASKLLRWLAVGLVLAAVVLFALSLWAVASVLGTCLGIASGVWLTAGLLALAIVVALRVLRGAV